MADPQQFFAFVSHYKRKERSLKTFAEQRKCKINVSEYSAIYVPIEALTGSLNFQFKVRIPLSPSSMDLLGVAVAEIVACL